MLMRQVFHRLIVSLSASLFLLLSGCGSGGGGSGFVQEV